MLVELTAGVKLNGVNIRNMLSKYKLNQQLFKDYGWFNIM